MKRAGGIILIILGSAMGIWCLMAAVRMVVTFSLSGASQIMAFVFYVLLVGGGVALVFLGRRLMRG